MSPSRLLVATVSAVAYPSLVGVVAAGILTFTTARVFAESATAPLQCTAPSVVDCADAAPRQQCTQCGTGLDCSCVKQSCFDDGGITESLACAGNVGPTCDHPIVGACAGLEVDAACVGLERGPGFYGVCQPSTCAVLDSGIWTDLPALVCYSYMSPPPTTAPDASSVEIGVDGGPSSQAAAPPKPSDPSDPSDSSDAPGCSVLSGSNPTSPLLAASALVLGVATLWRLRRRRR